MQKFLADQNKKSRDLSLWRTLSLLENSSAREVVMNGNKYLNFSSNDYLGYSTHPEVIKASKNAIDRYGAGGKSSRLISGTLDLHQELEESLAVFKGTEAALVFPTGFMANLAVVSSLLGQGDALIMDRLNHASLIDAGRLARCRIFVYDHCSEESLEKILRRTRSYAKRLVVTDSLFSMDGDFAPLDKIAAQCKKNKVWLMIDDAHATGIFGERGIGMGEYYNLLGKIDIVMGTLSKALGSQGGFVCGTRELIDHLKNKARPFIYTTALSPHACAAANTALGLIGRDPVSRKNLLDLSGSLRESFRKRFPSNFKHAFSPNSQIIPFWVGTAELALKLSNKLRESNIFVPAIRPPTVPKNSSRLRFSLSSRHSKKDLDQLLEVLETQGAAV